MMKKAAILYAMTGRLTFCRVPTSLLKMSAESISHYLGILELICVLIGNPTFKFLSFQWD